MSAMTGPESARHAGLHYANETHAGFSRRRRGKGFEYLDTRGRVIRNATTLKRIGALVLPPAWTNVWIAADPRGHLQATGKDAAGRRQYRYHPRWIAERDATKYHRMLDFAKALPKIRRRAARDLRHPPLSQPRVLATVVVLLERTHIRIGNEEYARTNKSHGLTTLRDRHVEISGGHLTFAFRAKSGVHQHIELDDARLARAVKQCQHLPGQTLFQYRGHDGVVRTVTSADVNAYLQVVASEEFTAKDYRTWAGTLVAARTLDEIGVAATASKRDRIIVQAIDRVAKELGNTRAVCRKCYVHPAVIDAYRSSVTIGIVSARRRPAGAGLSADEVDLVALLRSRGA